MSKVCEGGLYDGRPANTLEDAASCRENEGKVLPKESGGVCGMSNIAAMVFTPSSTKLNNSAVSSLLLLPLRLVRDSVPHSPMVSGLEFLNDGLSPEIERIATEDEQIRSALANTLVGVSYFAASMLESAGNGRDTGKSVFTESFYNQIVQLVEAIKPRLSNEKYIPVLDMATSSLSDLVGKNAEQVQSFLRHGA